MSFKDFYMEVVTTTSMGGASAQFADKVGKLKRRMKCKICGKEILDSEPYIQERRINGDAWHERCIKVN